MVWGLLNMSHNHHQDIIASIYFTKLIYDIIMISLLWMVQPFKSADCYVLLSQDSSKYHPVAKFITYHHKSHQDSKFITVSISIQNHHPFKIISMQFWEWDVLLHAKMLKSATVFGLSLARSAFMRKYSGTDLSFIVSCICFNLLGHSLLLKLK